jgi:hypothetical protein
MHLKSRDKANSPRFVDLNRLWSLTKIPVVIAVGSFATAELCYSIAAKIAPIFVLLGCLSFVGVILLFVWMSVAEIVVELFYRKHRTIGGVLGTLAFNFIVSGTLIVFGYFLVKSIFGLK